MSLFNRGWTTFDGEPVTGRVPTEMVIYAKLGAELSGEQRGGVLRAYKLFCDAIKLSSIPGGYHVQNRELADGTRIRMISHLEVHKVQVWVKDEGGKDIYRGFVLRPIWNDGDVEAGSPNTILLRYRDAKPDPVWENWVSPFKPGNSTETPTYFVDAIRSSHRVAGGEIISDQKYFDVYCLHNDKLYKNTKPAGGVASSFGSPIVLGTVDAPNTLFLADDDAAAICGTAGWETVVTRSALIEVLVSGHIFAAAARYNHSPQELKYLTTNITTPGAVQTWNITVGMLTAVPWVSHPAATFDQLDVQSPLITVGGWSNTYEQPPADPVFGPTTAGSRVCGYQYTTPGTSPNVLVGPVTASELAAPPGSVEYVRIYNRTPVSTESLNLYDDWVASISREVAIDSETTQRTGIGWMNKWPEAALWMAAIEPPGSTAEWRHVPAAGLSTPFLPTGGLINLCMLENSYVIDHLDVASSVTACSGYTIYQANSIHTILHRTVESWEHVPTVPPATQMLGGYGAVWKTLNPRASDLGAYVARTERTETFVGSATTRDYVYFDEDNSVRVWVEAVLSNQRTVSEEGDIGDLSLYISIKLASPAFSKEQFFLQLALDQGGLMQTTQPSDINFGSAPAVWTYVSPPRGDPVFSPLWQVQGLCPHIAYTTAAEEAAGIVPRMLASFRLQLQETNRPAVDDFVAIEGAVGFRPYMMEQMLNHYWRTGARGVFQEVEVLTAKLDASYPGPNIHTNLALPGADTSLQTNYYRT